MVAPYDHTVEILCKAWPLRDEFWDELAGFDDDARLHIYLMSYCTVGKSKFTGLHVIRALMASGGLGRHTTIERELASDTVPEWAKSALRGEPFAESRERLLAGQRMDTVTCPHCHYIVREVAGRRAPHPRFN